MVSGLLSEAFNTCGVLLTNKKLLLQFYSMHLTAEWSVTTQAGRIMTIVWPWLKVPW